MTILTHHGPQFPQIAGALPPSSTEQIDRALSELHAHKDKWVKTSITERIQIVEQIRRDVLKLAPRWVQLNLDAKGLDAREVASADEWSAAAIMIRMLRLLHQSLQEIQRYGRPRFPGRLRTRPDGQVIVPVYPQSLYDRLLFRGLRGEVWMEPGVSPEETVRTQAACYHDKDHAGKITLVLGAGNYSPLVPNDFMYKLFQEDSVVILKMNPVNDYLGPLIEEGYQALIERGFLRVIYGGIREAQYMIHHNLVDALHLTGSDKTFETIVFGPGEDGAQRKAQRQPVMTKPFSAELGSVSPLIIVPGPWREDDIRYQADQIALMMTVNAAFTCLTTRVVIQHAGWSLRKRLNQAIGDILKALPTRKAYYPGAKERHTRFVSEHPEAYAFGDGGGDKLPWTMIPDIDPNHVDDICFTTEAFCCVLSETGIEAVNVVEYINRAVEFCNHTLWGTLSATIIVHPESLKDRLIAAAVEDAVARLRYGTIGVNVWHGYGMYMQTTPWGSISGQDIYDVQSGIGFVNNQLMLSKPQKSVLYGSFRPSPNPVRAQSKTYHLFAQKFLDFEANPSWRKLPGLVWLALKS